jgi:hypothetical protein
MSWSPCSNCHGTNGGRLQFAYIATFEGEKRLSHRLRLCEKCWEAFLPDLLMVADWQDDERRWHAPEDPK